MTPEEFAEACLPSSNWPDDLKDRAGDMWKAMRAAIAKRFRTEIDAAVLAERARCAKEACAACRRGDPLGFLPDMRVYVHGEAGQGRNFCRASSIWSGPAIRAGTEKEG